MENDKVLTPTDKEALEIYKDIIGQELSLDVIDYGTEPGLRAIHVVARAGDIDLARALLRKQADVNFTTSMIRLLIVYGAKVNMQSLRDGRTALHTATERGDVDIVQVLLEHGANADIVSKDGLSAKDIAVETDNDAVIRLFNEYQQRPQPPIRSTSAFSFPSTPPTCGGIFKLMKARTPTADEYHFATPPSPRPEESDSSFPQPASITEEEFFGNMSQMKSRTTYYNEAPPSYDEVMNPDPGSLFGRTAYSIEEPEDNDTTALLGDE